MNRLCVLTLTFLIASFGLNAQNNSMIQIDKYAEVYGTKIIGAQVRVEYPNSLKKGVEILVKTTSKSAPNMEHFDWRIRFFDKYGKVILDTSVRQYCPLVEEDENQTVQYFDINTNTGDTIIRYGISLAFPPREPLSEKGRKKETKYYGYFGLWPKNAVTAKVGLDHVDYGTTTYYAPGRL